MNYCTVRLYLLILCIVTNATMTMEYVERNSGVRVVVKNLSEGIASSYDIYTQMIPTLSASQTVYDEIFIPYGKTKIIGMLTRIDDIRTRGSSVMSSWAYNKDLLNKIKQDAGHKGISGAHLQLVVTAGVTGFYISYYNWVPDNGNFSEYS